MPFNYSSTLLVIFLIALSSDNISGIRSKPTVLEGSNLQLICKRSLGTKGL